MTNPVLVEVIRGGRVESHHRGSVAIFDARGKCVTAIGDVAERIFPRSAVKAIQALPLIESGAADHYAFGPAELALACSSHSGEPRHVEAAARMLAAAGRSERDLACGGHPPLDSASAAALVRDGVPFSRLHDNCSGKHAGVICTACHLGLDPDGYERPNHAAEAAVTAALATVTGIDPGPPAVDGCAMPAFAIPLANLAAGFARMVTGEGLPSGRAAAARRLVDACTREPMMTAGTGRFDSVMLVAFAGRLFLKGGAEGVWCLGLPSLGLGAAVKFDDGAQRAAEVAAAAIVETLLPVTEVDRAALLPHLAPHVRTRAGATVGELRPTAGFLASLREARVS